MNRESAPPDAPQITNRFAPRLCAPSPGWASRPPALGYAHDQGIVHRDVKPGQFCWIVVATADFGMADVQGDAGLTMTGDLPGTLRYMSPEQAAGKRADRSPHRHLLAGRDALRALTLQPAVVGRGPRRRSSGGSPTKSPSRSAGSIRPCRSTWRRS